MIKAASTGSHPTEPGCYVTFFLKQEGEEYTVGMDITNKSGASVLSQRPIYCRTTDADEAWNVFKKQAGW